MSLINIKIKELVRKWGIHPFDINNGCCEEFAEIIEAEVNGARMEWGRGFEALFTSKHDPDSHCYIVFAGKYYDAEEPYGVDNPVKLPLYRRQIND